MPKLVIGCGYLGIRVAQRWSNAGEMVYAVTRSAARAEVLRGQGLHPIVADVTDPSSLTSLPNIETVLYAVGFDRTAGKSKRDVYVNGLAAALAAVPSSVRRFLYVSSTSVYGQQSGEWIDESSPREPCTEEGRICLAAEETLERHALGPVSCILCLAGIYGPGRVPRREALAKGEPIAARPDAYLNLIHVDDATSAVIAAADAETLGPRYLVADSHPVIRREYYRELARLWGQGEPQFAEVVEGTVPTGRGATNKRVSNRRLLGELKLNLKYPSYREGLAAILAVESD